MINDKCLPGSVVQGPVAGVWGQPQLWSRLWWEFAGAGVGAEGLDDLFKLRLKFRVVFVPAGKVDGDAACYLRLFT